MELIKGNQPTMTIEEVEKKAAEVKKAVTFAYIHRRMPRTEILNPSGFEGLSIIEMLVAIRVDSEASDSGNIRRSDYEQIFDDFLQVVSISSHIPVSKAVRDALQVDKCRGYILPKEGAFEGLPEEVLISEFPWRLDRLVCGLYSLPIKVIDEDPKSRRWRQSASY
jgi:hypothetical protein